MHEVVTAPNNLLKHLRTAADESGVLPDLSFRFVVLTDKNVENVLFWIHVKNKWCQTNRILCFFSHQFMRK